MDGEPPPASKRAARPWSLVAIGALLLGAAALCCRGSLAVIDNYDGFTSWFNGGSCCIGALLATAALVWLLVRKP